MLFSQNQGTPRRRIYPEEGRSLVKEFVPTMHAESSQINPETVVVLAMLRLDLGEEAKYTIGEPQESGRNMMITPIDLFGERGILGYPYYGRELKLNMSFIRGSDSAVLMALDASAYLRIEVPNRDSAEYKVLWVCGEISASAFEKDDTVFLRIEFPYISGLRPTILAPL